MEWFRLDPDGFNDYAVSEKLERPVIIGDCSRACLKILSEEFIESVPIPKIGVTQDDFFVIAGPETMMDGIQIDN